MKPSDVLIRIVTQHGRVILDSPQRLAHLVREAMLPQDFSAYYLCLYALKLRIPHQLTAHEIFSRTIRQKMATQMCANDAEISPAQAYYAIDAWAFALRVECATTVQLSHHQPPTVQPDLVQLVDAWIDSNPHTAIQPTHELALIEDIVPTKTIHLVSPPSKMITFLMKIRAFLALIFKGIKKKQTPLLPYATPIDSATNLVWVDEKTGLMWMRYYVGQTMKNDRVQGSAALLMWDSAQKMAAKAGDAGYVDWRLPSIDELRTVMQHADATLLRATSEGAETWPYCWSNTVHPESKRYVWCADLEKNESHVFQYENVAMVRLVRQSVALPQVQDREGE